MYQPLLGAEWSKMRIQDLARDASPRPRRDHRRVRQALGEHLIGWGTRLAGQRQVAG